MVVHTGERRERDLNGSRMRTLSKARKKMRPTRRKRRRSGFNWVYGMITDAACSDLRAVSSLDGPLTIGHPTCMPLSMLAHLERERDLSMICSCLLSASRSGVGIVRCDCATTPPLISRLPIYISTAIAIVLHDTLIMKQACNSAAAAIW